MIAATQLLIVLDGSIIAIALPFIGASFAVSGGLLTWSITGYVLAFGALLLPAGRLGDVLGHRRALLIGLVAFGVASAVGGLAPVYEVLLGARVAQGAAAALAAPAALALISTTFPGESMRRRAFAVYAAVSGAGAALGLVAGGALTAVTSIGGLAVEGWRLTFLALTPVALLVAAIAAAVIPSLRGISRRVDLVGTVTVTAALALLVLGLTLAGEHGTGFVWIALPVGAGVILLAAFVFVERKIRDPLLPLRILRDRQRGVVLVVLAIAQGAQFAAFYFLTLFVQQVLGFGPLETGLAFVPMSLGIVLGAIIASRALARVEGHHVGAAGLLLSAVGAGLLALIDIEPSGAAALGALTSGPPLGVGVDYWMQVLVPLLVMATGTGAMFTALTPMAVARVDSSDVGILSGLVNAVQQLGGAFAIVAFSTVSLLSVSFLRAGVQREVEALGGPRSMLEAAVRLAVFTEGMRTAFVVSAAVLVLASVAMLLGGRRRVGDSAAPSVRQLR